MDVEYCPIPRPVAVRQVAREMSGNLILMRALNFFHKRSNECSFSKAGHTIEEFVTSNVDR